MEASFGLGIRTASHPLIVMILRDIVVWVSIVYLYCVSKWASATYFLDVLVEYLIFHEVEALLKQVYVPEMFYVKNEFSDASECHFAFDI